MTSFTRGAWRPFSRNQSQTSLAPLMMSDRCLKNPLPSPSQLPCAQFAQLVKVNCAGGFSVIVGVVAIDPAVGTVFSSGTDSQGVAVTG